MDLNRISHIIEKKLLEEDYTSLELAAALLRMNMGEENEDIINTLNEIVEKGTGKVSQTPEVTAQETSKQEETAAPAGGAGSVKIEAGAAGKVFKIEASVGQAVKKGDAVLVLEIMKMETPVVAPQDGTVASINVNVGDMVEAGALLATLN